MEDLIPQGVKPYVYNQKESVFQRSGQGAVGRYIYRHAANVCLNC